MVIKNRGRRVPAFPGGVAGSESRLAPHRIEETASAPLPGLPVPGASHPCEPGLLALASDPRAEDLTKPSRTGDGSDRTVLVDASVVGPCITLWVTGDR